MTTIVLMSPEELIAKCSAAKAHGAAFTLQAWPSVRRRLGLPENLAEDNERQIRAAFQDGQRVAAPPPPPFIVADDAHESLRQSIAIWMRRPVAP